MTARAPRLLSRRLDGGASRALRGSGARTGRRVAVRLRGWPEKRLVLRGPRDGLLAVHTARDGLLAVHTARKPNAKRTGRDSSRYAGSTPGPHDAVPSPCCAKSTFTHKRSPATRSRVCVAAVRASGDHGRTL